MRDPHQYDNWDKHTVEVSVYEPPERGSPLVGICIGVVLGVAFWIGLWLVLR